MLDNSRHGWPVDASPDHKRNQLSSALPKDDRGGSIPTQLTEIVRFLARQAAAAAFQTAEKPDAPDQDNYH
ncbi:hypothetical protein [Magnetospirillum sp. ME-1]|uniref:hypothetical protein n=1 Tax=Magnetospirillum sp. ME-1 TaxID=1639348 RepID=UPI00143D2D76|nr:hypothetical protein [Magnetospirillum sp. ME-1]